jgi:cytochrome c-type biogenesis protein CcmF
VVVKYLLVKEYYLFLPIQSITNTIIMDIQYMGEHLLPGQFGRLMILLALISAFISAWLYFQATTITNPLKAETWQKRSRIAWFLHSAFIFVASAILMYLLMNRFYEYRYVWAHVENDLSAFYLIASFWAGQEGSLLFWALCQVIIGLFLVKYAAKWENPVMSIVSLSQFFMTSILLGFTVGSTQIGMSPFTLLREASSNADSEFFQNPYYLSLILDGNGLNPLLRNFWMMSHPPVLFVGFALALVPFAYALAGIWTKQYIEWIRPSLPWTNLGVFFLGAGILLGGVWAYESLTFGGFWAWDPIENASLVPWIILVAALHLKLVVKRKQENIFPAFLFTFLAFIFVIYSTYLTRSGVLAETSVHSFGNDGMGNHILIYMFSFLLMAVIPLALHYKRLPSKENDEPFSREFWLFIAAMVLVLSAFQIIFTTSIPVWNKLFGSSLSPAADVVDHYNTWQLPFAVLVSLLIGLAHFMKWGKNDMKSFIRSSTLSAGLALVTTVIIIALSDIRFIAHWVFMFSGFYAFYSAMDMILRFRKQVTNMPAMISHLGIALFFVALVLTFAQKETISRNTSGYNLGESFPANENLLLIKDEILPMGKFYVTYKGNYVQGEDIFYKIDFLRKNANDEYYMAFESKPSIKLNDKMGNVYNPFAKIYPNRDIFTYITFADVSNPGVPKEPTLLEKREISLKDTIVSGHNRYVLSDITAVENPQDLGGDVVIEATVEIITHFNRQYIAKPKFILQGNTVHFQDDVIRELDLRFRFAEVSDSPKTIWLEMYQETPDFIIIKTIIFPYINLLWLSCIIMLVGFWMTWRRRWKRRKHIAKNA